MRKISFHSFAWLAGGISIFVFVAGIVITILYGGFEFSIDFNAGLSVDVRIAGAKTVESVEAALADIEQINVRRIGSVAEEQFMVRVRHSEGGNVKTFQAETEQNVRSMLENNFSSVEILQSSYIGPRFSQTLRYQTFVLVVATLLLVSLYLWMRFRISYAIASIVALIHDLAILLVFFGVSRLEISSATVAAALTILGYSLNDTIIIFDRIRENTKLMKDQRLTTIIDTSITQSLSRTIITSVTTLLAVFAIAIFAQGSIRYFAISLIVGIIVGTYSSIFVASPVLLLFMRRSQKGRKENQELEPENAPTEDNSSSSIQSNVNVEVLKREIGFNKQEKPKKKRSKSH